jgi:TonB family protein
MSTALHLGRREDLTAWVGGSVGAHVLLIGFCWWMARDTGPIIDLNAKPIQAHLVRQGEKRDEKLLPRMQPNAPPPTPEAVAIPSKPTPSVPLEPHKPKPKPQAKPNLNQQLFSMFDKTKPSHPQNAIGEANGDPEGDVDKADESERYFGILSSRIKRNYDVSSAISDAERVRLMAKIVLYIDANGSVLHTEWASKSGNSLFDGAVAAAVQKAAPFPPPPQFLAKDLSNVGVALNFRP